MGGTALSWKLIVRAHCLVSALKRVIIAAHVSHLYFFLPFTTAYTARSDLLLI
jgi:hypothetical protein